MMSHAVSLRACGVSALLIRPDVRVSPTPSEGRVRPIEVASTADTIRAIYAASVGRERQRLAVRVAPVGEAVERPLVGPRLGSVEQVGVEAVDTIRAIYAASVGREQRPGVRAMSAAAARPVCASSGRRQTATGPHG